MTRSSRRVPTYEHARRDREPGGRDAIDPLRVIVTHMIEETRAGSAGHADILREQIDGVTND